MNSSLRNNVAKKKECPLFTTTLGIVLLVFICFIKFNSSRFQNLYIPLQHHTMAGVYKTFTLCVSLWAHQAVLSLECAGPCRAEAQQRWWGCHIPGLGLALGTVTGAAGFLHLRSRLNTSPQRRR